jgi:HTH-type transcriptional repressor of NAD biosynthesis genes
MSVGVFPGKFLPPHRGHLTGILRAHSLCDQLYVVISERMIEDSVMCATNNLPYISGVNRLRWLTRELKGFNIKVKLIDESNIPLFPSGWKEYSDLVRDCVNEKIDIVFGGEKSYSEGHKKYFPEAEYIILDPKREKWNISGTKIRESLFQHWDYIIGAARPFFAKRVLITGPESCGKTLLTKKLAKIFYTSWSEEVGRLYQEEIVGCDGRMFVLEDFNRIVNLQYEQDLKALESANKVCFFDTDAVVTKFYSNYFLGETADRIERFIDPKKYDLIFALKPTVPLIDDGMRATDNIDVRNSDFDCIMKMYRDFGFDMSKFIVIESSKYFERLEICIAEVEKLIK